MSNVQNKFDIHGNEKVQCRICQKWYHQLESHIAQHHGSVEEYKSKHPGAPIISKVYRFVEECKKRPIIFK